MRTNLNRQTFLTKQADAPSLLPKSRDIRNFIDAHVRSIAPPQEDPDEFKKWVLANDSVTKEDPQLVIAAKLLKLKGKSEVRLEDSLVFILCEECDIHMFKRDRGNTTTICEPCRSKRNNERKNQKNREKNKAQR